MEADKNPFPKLEVVSPLAKLSRLAQFIFRMPHTFASHGDHEFVHDPLLSPDETPKQWGKVIDIQGRDI